MVDFLEAFFCSWVMGWKNRSFVNFKVATAIQLTVVVYVSDMEKIVFVSSNRIRVIKVFSGFLGNLILFSICHNET